MVRILSLILSVALALPTPISAQRLPTLPDPRPRPAGSEATRIYVPLEEGRRLPNDRIEAKTRSGACMQFPPDGMTTDGKLIASGGFHSPVVYLRPMPMGEIGRIIEDEVPPHKWGRLRDWRPEEDDNILIHGPGTTKF